MNRASKGEHAKEEETPFLEVGPGEAMIRTSLQWFWVGLVQADGAD